MKRDSSRVVEGAPRLRGGDDMATATHGLKSEEGGRMREGSEGRRKREGGTEGGRTEEGGGTADGTTPKELRTEKPARQFCPLIARPIARPIVR